MNDEIKPARRWTLGGYAPGGYMCKCLTCSETFTGDKRAIACLPCAAVATEARAKASEALVRELVEGLKGIAADEYGDTHRELAQALILRAENPSSSVVESAALLAPQANCSAAQSLDGREG